MSPRPPQLDRAHLEALLIAHALMDDTLLTACVDERLSPAANALLDRIEEYPALARVALVELASALYPNDVTADLTYMIRLAERVTRLILPELTFWSRETIVALVNRLPIISEQRQAA